MVKPFVDMSNAPLFKLQISPSFDLPEKFEVANVPDYRIEYTSCYGAGGDEWGVPSKVIVPLSEGQYKKILDSIDAALGAISLLDDTLGLDGVTYVLESSRHQSVNLSIWTPQENTEKRGLGNLLKLEEELRRLLNQNTSRA
ncbi:MULTISPECIES: hypothetical protein [Microbulbifer]|uniref:hypothetical protein n=1 Tax=Microbulbifer TaxID=48073 RepID=UPI001142CCEB|nr:MULTISPECIES: hypothetical protein [Microbulbifer]